MGSLILRVKKEFDEQVMAATRAPSRFSKHINALREWYVYKAGYRQMGLRREDLFMPGRVRIWMKLLIDFQRKKQIYVSSVSRERPIYHLNTRYCPKNNGRNLKRT